MLFRSQASVSWLVSTSLTQLGLFSRPTIKPSLLLCCRLDAWDGSSVEPLKVWQPELIATTSANIASAKLRRMGWVICSLFRQITGINQYAFQKVCAILGSSIARVKFIGQLCELKMYLSMCAKLQTLRWRTAKLFALFVLQHL